MENNKLPNKKNEVDIYKLTSMIYDTMQQLSGDSKYKCNLIYSLHMITTDLIEHESTFNNDKELMNNKLNEIQILVDKLRLL